MAEVLMPIAFFREFFQREGSDWLPLDMRTTPPAAMPAFRGFEEPSPDGVVHLGEGIAVCEEQLRAVKWSDYRKLTRGLAAILFSPTELATCSVTGQRWSRAGTATERPVKPALDKAKVQAIIYQTNTIRNFNFYFENGENIFGDLMKMNLERVSTNSTTMFPHLKRALGKRSGQACVPTSIEFSRAKINIDNDDDNDDDDNNEEQQQQQQQQQRQRSLEENLTGRETFGESSSSETTSSLGGLMRLHAIHRALQATLRTAAASYF
ncbi:hypothetical protein HZH68_004548 [Vespula germanica]|uniref:BEN domain-containing protein n=1 Tax=Vespula germanica TaxID=30212 RepID=A0A834KP52_VESGE|nr:hypothetical protein HZH68_004548 [Vespula germanica]